VPVIATAARSTLLFNPALLRCQHDNTSLQPHNITRWARDSRSRLPPAVPKLAHLGSGAGSHSFHWVTGQRPANRLTLHRLRLHGLGSSRAPSLTFLAPLPSSFIIRCIGPAFPGLLACLAAPFLPFPLWPCCRALDLLPSESSHPLAIALPLPATHICSFHPPSTLIEPITAAIKSPSRTPSEKAHRIDNDDPKQRPLNRLHSKLLPAGSQFVIPCIASGSLGSLHGTQPIPHDSKHPTSSPSEPYHRREKLHRSIYWPESQ
jgi:hypothetical protein